MKYLIDFTMLYDVASSRLLPMNNEETGAIRLSNQSARLLYELLLNKGEVVDRDELIKVVWEDQGFTGSSVSLNVAISEIRKAFRMLSHDPQLIKTFRGKGFCLAAHVENVMKKEVSKPYFLEKDSEPTKNKSVQKVVNALFIFIFLIMTCSLLVYLHMEKENLLIKLDDSFKTNLIVQIDNCSIYTRTGQSSITLDSMKAIINKKIVSSGIDCTHKHLEVFFEALDKNGFNGNFLSFCEQQSSGKIFKNCVSFREITTL